MSDTSHDDHLRGIDARLAETAAAMRTERDFHRFITRAAGFERFTAENQLYLAAQGATGAVATPQAWAAIPAINGEPCRARNGEYAHHIVAPLTLAAPGRDSSGPGRRRTIAVFDETQLVSPPAVTVAPIELDAGDRIIAVAVLRQFERSTSPQPTPATTAPREPHTEFETNAAIRVVAKRLGIPSTARGETGRSAWMDDRVQFQESARRVLAHVDELLGEVEHTTGIELRADIFNLAQPATHVAALPQTVDNRASIVHVDRGVPAHPDDVVARHLAAGELDWRRLAHELPGADTDRFLAASDHPAERAIALAEAGVSSDGIADVLVAADVPVGEIVAALLVDTIDANGEKGPLFADDELVTVLPSLGVSYEAAAELRTTSPAAAVDQNSIVRAPTAATTSAKALADPLISAWTSIPTRPRDSQPADRLVTFWRNVGTSPTSDLPTPSHPPLPWPDVR